MSNAVRNSKLDNERNTAVYGDAPSELLGGDRICDTSPKASNRIETGVSSWRLTRILGGGGAHGPKSHVCVGTSARRVSD